jgi:hypothetical protein
MMPPAMLLAYLLEGEYAEFFAGLVAASQATVPRDMTLEEFLYTIPVPRWKQKMLLTYERIGISRKQPNGSLGPNETAQQLSEMLRAGDQVQVDDSAKGDTFDAEFTGARDSAKDYVDAPDADPNDFLLGESQTLHFRRGSHMFGSLTGETTLQDFIQSMGRNENVDGPPRNIYVVSHAHWSGQLSFAPTNAPEDQDLSFSYESIDAIGSGLALPGAFLEPRSEANKTPLIVFTGCSFGQAEPFLRRLRDAINPKLAAVAPTFLYGIARKTDGSVYFEYMAKPYVVYSKGKLNRAALMTQLKPPAPAPKLKDAHGDSVKDEEWEPWVPLEPWPAGSFYLERLELRTVLWHSVINVDLPAVSVNLDEATFRANAVAKYKAAVAALPRDPRHLLSAECPYPQWRRFGLANANAMIDTFEVTFKYTARSGGGGIVVANLKGHRYAVIVPIVEQKLSLPYERRRLLMNAYSEPQPGGGLVPAGITDYPFPKLPLSGQPASNTKYWKVIEPAA